jgi:hypothetical protein
VDTLAYPGYAAERSSSNELDGAWRRAALIALGIAALELVALIAVLVAVVARPFAHVHPAAAATAPPVVHRASPVRRPRPAAQLFSAAALPPASTHVLVLNGNGRSGAAAAEAAALTARGYRIAATGNAPRTDYAATLVMYRPGFVREARLLAHAASIHVVAPLDGLRGGHMRQAQLVVILGR